MIKIPVIAINSECYNEMIGEEVVASLAYVDHPGIFVFDNSSSIKGSEKAVSFLKLLCANTRAVVLAKVRAGSKEDIKEILSAGCKFAVVDFHSEVKEEVLVEIKEQFGSDKLIAYVPCGCSVKKYKKEYDKYFLTVITAKVFKETLDTDLQLSIINDEGTVLDIEKEVLNK